MTRLFDVILSSLGLLLGLPLFAILFILGLFDTGAPIFCQDRVGRNQRSFRLFKFRTMRTNAVQVATHLADPSAVTPFGHFLRKSKLDELPQLWNVLCGQMSLVGPRPCLTSQNELIAERAARRVFDVRPGITGLAQINAIDMSTPQLLAETDARMLATMNGRSYFRFIFLTIAGKGLGDRIRNRLNP